MTISADNTAAKRAPRNMPDTCIPFASPVRKYGSFSD